MSKGNSIIVSSEPRGHFDEGTIVGAILPGTMMMMQAATAFTNGRPSWVPLATGGADALPAPIVVLVEDDLQGKLMTDAYVTGTRGRLYWPINGEELNMRVGEAGGTANTITQGDKLMVDAEDGILVPNGGTPYALPFQAMETVTQKADGTLVWCKFQGT